MTEALAFTWLKEVLSGIGKLKSLEKHYDPAQRAAGGQQPYEQSKEVRAELRRLEDLSKTLREIASKGIGEPEKGLEWKDFPKIIKQLEGSDKERDKAAKEFLVIQLSRIEFADKAEKLGKSLDEVGASAAKGSKATLEIRDVFFKLAETFPDPTGGTIKAQHFECYQTFLAASGALGNLAGAADAAAKKVKTQVGPVGKKTDELTKVFQGALKASEKGRKDKKK